jgi:hypothetical protein
MAASLVQAVIAKTCCWILIQKQAWVVLFVTQEVMLELQQHLVEPSSYLEPLPCQNASFSTLLQAQGVE